MINREPPPATVVRPDMLLLLACAEPPPEVHKLIDLYRPVLQLNTGILPGGKEQVQLLVHPQFPGLCHPIPTIAATLDGKPMERLHGRVEGPPPYDRDCSIFEFTIDGALAAIQPQNTVRVTDGETTFEVVVANLFAPRTMTVSATAAKVGETLTVAWSPSTDTVAKKGSVGFLFEIGDKRAIVKRADLAVGPGSFTFKVPAGVLGEAKLSAFGTDQITPAVVSCTGAHTCNVARSYDVPAAMITLTE